jgi:hypothetical protein
LLSPAGRDDPGFYLRQLVELGRDISGDERSTSRGDDQVMGAVPLTDALNVRQQLAWIHAI